MGFRALWLSRTVSFLGDGVSTTALVLLTARHGASAVAVVLLAQTVPRFLGPVGGALADHVDRRALLRVCELGQAVVYAVVAALLPSIPVLAVLVAVAALLQTAVAPASSSAVPDLVPPARLARANALLGTALNLQVAVGPAVGGLLIGLGGARTAFAVDAGTFVVSAAVLALLPRLPPTGARSRLAAATVEGLRYVWGRRPLRAFVLGTAVFVAFAAVDNVALVFLVERSLHGSPLAFGLVQACFGAGMLAASLGLAARSRRRGAALVLVGAGATALGSLGTALAPELVAAGAGQLVAGVGNGVTNVGTSTYVQQQVPASMLGRTFGAVQTAAQVGSGIAYVVAAPLVAGVGARATFGVAAVGALVGLAVLAVGTRGQDETTCSPPPGTALGT